MALTDCHVVTPIVLATEKVSPLSGIHPCSHHQGVKLFMVHVFNWLKSFLNNKCTTQNAMCKVRVGSDLWHDEWHKYNNIYTWMYVYIYTVKIYVQQTQICGTCSGSTQFLTCGGTISRSQFNLQEPHEVRPETNWHYYGISRTCQTSITHILYK